MKKYAYFLGWNRPCFPYFPERFDESEIKLVYDLSGSEKVIFPKRKLPVNPVVACDIAVGLDSVKASIEAWKKDFPFLARDRSREVLA